MRPFAWLLICGFPLGLAAQYTAVPAPVAGCKPASAPLGASCTPCLSPDASLSISRVALDGTGRVVLSFTDPNPPADVTGYNVYRSLSPLAWTIIGNNASDMDPGTAQVQFIESGAFNCGAICFFQVAAYNGVCNAEGSWSTLSLTAPPGVTVTEGSTAGFSVVMTGPPSSPLTVDLASSAPWVMTIGNVPAQLTFDSGNWNQSHTVTVVGVSDADADDCSAHVILTSPSTPAKHVPVRVIDDEIFLTDLSVQMGPAAGGTAASAAGSGINASVTAAMTGNPVAGPVAVSPIRLDFTTPAKGAANPNFSDLRLDKGANSATLPRAYYYGQWAAASNGISGGTVNAILSVTATTVYAATNEGVYRSDDSSTTYVTASAGLPAGVINGLAGTVAAVYASTSAGIYLTPDSGASWALSGTLAVATACVTAVPATTIVLACAGTDIRRSTDGGVTWNIVKSGLSSPRLIRMANDGIGYLATAAGIFKTTDSGATWNPANGNLALGDVSTLAVHPSFGNTVAFIAIYPSIYVTIDGGTTWTVSLNLGGYATRAIVINNQAGSNAYAATDNGIYKTQWSATPQTWTLNSTGIPSVAAPRALTLRPTNGNLLAGMLNWGVYRTTNFAAAWAKADAGLTAYSATALAPHPVISGTAFATTSFGLFKTTDHGVTWASSSSGITGNLNGLTVNYAPSQPATMFAGFNGGGLWKSVDAGASWNATGIASGTINMIAIDPTNPNIVLAATTGSGSACVQKSTNGGTNFSSSGSGINCTSQVTGVLYLGTALFALEANNGVWKSVDGGANWTASSTGFPAGAANRLKVDAGGTLYAVNGGNGVYRSGNGGVSWTLAAAVTTGYAIDPTRVSTAYLIGNNSGVNNLRRTLNGFITLSGFASGLPQAAFSGELGVDTAGGTVYFSPANRGIYRVSD